MTFQRKKPGDRRPSGGFAVGGKRKFSPEYPCVSRFRQRRLFVFLSHQNLHDTYEALLGEMDVFMCEYHLVGLVRRGHWSDGIKYLSRFLPSERLLGVHGRALFHFLRVHQAIDYIFCGAREAVAVAAAVSVCRERLGTTSSHGLSKLCGILSSLLESKRLRDSVNILSVRHQAFLVIIDLVRQTPELKDRRRGKCGGSMNPQNVLPLGFGHASFRPRRHVKKGGAWVPASLVAGLYLQKKKMLPSSTPSDHSHGLTRESLIKAKEWLVDLVDRSLEAGRPRQGEPFQSACNEGAPVTPAPQTVFGTFRRPARNSYLSTLDLKKEAREWMLYLTEECLEAWPQVSYFSEPEECPDAWPQVSYFSEPVALADRLSGNMPDSLSRSAKTSAISSVTEGGAPFSQTEFGTFTDAVELSGMTSVTNAGVPLSEVMPCTITDSAKNTVTDSGTYKRLTQEGSYTEVAHQSFGSGKNSMMELITVGGGFDPRRCITLCWYDLLKLKLEIALERELE